MNRELPDVQAGFRKGRGTRDQIANIWLDHQKSKRVLGKHLLLLYWLHKSLWLCGSQQTVENSSRDRNTRPPYVPPEKSVCRVKKQQLEPDMEQQTGSKLGKEYIKTVYCHPAYLTYMQSTSCERLDEAQGGIKTARRNINNLRYTDNTTVMAESEEELESLLMKVKEESWLKTQHSKI